LPFVLCKIETLAEVYDNVLDSETTEWLHGECLKAEQSQSDVGFAFPLKQPLRHSTIEQFLNNLLFELYPDGNGYYVEYWTRNKWVLISAHQDMDEEHEKQMQLSGKTRYGDKLIHPETGHVLYLKVGSQVKGPTVVWNETRGGDFSEQSSEMVIIPAVQGRLTRFQGNALHAVPRPAGVYWTKRVDSGSHEPEYMRSVILFNTWPMNKEKPIGIDISDAIDKDIEMNRFCNKKGQWKDVFIESLSSDPDPSETSTFKIPLMGDLERRGTEDFVAKLQTQTKAKEAFLEKTKVSSAVVRVEANKAWFSFWGYEF
jgi:hypothetical protein